VYYKIFLGCGKTKNAPMLAMVSESSK
jgi:hypothetical protein